MLPVTHEGADMARLAKVYQCMGMKLRMCMLMNIGLGIEFMEKKRFGPEFAFIL